MIRADCGHLDASPYRVCPWTGKLRGLSLCRTCYEDACRRAQRDRAGAGPLRLDSDRHRKPQHGSEAA